MKNINLSTTTDRHIVTIVVTNPTLPLANHLLSASAITYINHQHRWTTTLGLGYILLFLHRHQSHRQLL